MSSVDPAGAAPGRPQPLAERGLLAGVDLGGTKIAAVISDGERILARSRCPVPRHGEPERVSEAMIQLLDQCCGDARVSRDRIEAVGVSACGPFIGSRGDRKTVAPNLCQVVDERSGALNKWEAVPIEAPLAAQFGRVVLVNDAQAALVAEHRFGVLKESEHCAYLTWSTGIGVGLIVDGRLLSGKAGNSGHAGHSLVPSTSPVVRCGCGNTGDVESLAGGAALARAWGGSTESLFEACEKGDSRALALVETATEAVADLIYNLVVTLDLSCVAIGGGLFGARCDMLLPMLRRKVFDASRRPGMRGMLAGFSIVPVVNAARTAEMGALSLVLDESVSLAWPPEQAFHV